MLRALTDWWANFTQIEVPGVVCPPAPNGEPQAAVAVIAQTEWASAFDTAAIITLVLIGLLVLIAYETRSMGNRFWKRWLGFLVAAAVTAGVAVYGYLSWVWVQTTLCEHGDVLTHIPAGYVRTRAGVALVQGIVLFFVLSVFLTLVARVWKRDVWYDKVKIPLPI